jgi:hypothetical protein
MERPGEAAWQETDTTHQGEENSTELFRGIRIALVCYGGVSLAIYVHGVTRALRRPVTASSRFDAKGTSFDRGAPSTSTGRLLHHFAARDRCAPAWWWT